MLVQLPCTYTAGTGQGVATLHNGDKRETFEVHDETSSCFDYIFVHRFCNVHLNDPLTGCAAFLLCDVVCPGVYPSPQCLIEDDSYTAKTIRAFVKLWDSDSDPEKDCIQLAVVLQEPWEQMRQRGRLSAADLL